MIPLVLGAFAVGGSVFGLKKGKEGLDKLKEAKRMVERAAKKYNKCYSMTSECIESFLNNDLRTLGETRVEIAKLKKEIYEVFTKLEAKVKKQTADIIWEEKNMEDINLKKLD